eukprot:UN12507
MIINRKTSKWKIFGKNVPIGMMYQEECKSDIRHA